MENDKLRKIFVGNVPYQCTVDEFQNTFNKIDGFMDADIIIDKNTNMCKGFGFVRLNTIQNAEKLLKKTDLKINGRELRLTGYTSTLRYSNDEKIGYIYVDNIPDNCDRMYLKNIFTGYPIGVYYVNTDIDTGIPKNNGIVEILNTEKYKELLSMGSITDKNGNIIKLLGCLM
jgi:hypothetical protein